MEPYDLFFQVGMVGAFMVWALVVLKHFRDFLVSRNEQFQLERNQRDQEWRNWLANRDAVFMEFLRDERGHRADHMQVGMTELNKVTSAVRDLATVMGQHDSAAKDRYDKIMKRLERVKLNA